MGLVVCVYSVGWSPSLLNPTLHFVVNAIMRLLHNMNKYNVRVVTGQRYIYVTIGLHNNKSQITQTSGFTYCTPE